MKTFDSRKALPFGALVLAFTLVIQAVAPTEVAAVKDLVMTPGEDSVEAQITTTAQAKYTYFELTGPRRLVMDFRDVQNELAFKEKQVSVAGVERIRAGMFQDKDRNATRIVFDLNEAASYRVLDDKSGLLRIVFAQNNPVTTTPLAPFLAEVPVEPVLIAETQMPTSLAAPVVVPVTAQLAVQSPAMPRFNLQSLSLAAPGITIPPVGSPLSLASVAPALLPQIQVVPPLVPGTTITGPPQATQYSGEIVSFDVRDLDLKDFFRLISETSGLNIILDPNVSGTLPMLHLTDVPWDQALDVVLKQNQLGGQLQGNVLRIATNATLLAEENARRAQLEAREALTETVTHTFILNYTKADVVSATLTKSLTKRGQIIADARKNALIVSDVPDQFTRIDQLVKFLDTPAQQVEIEARLLSANKAFSRDLGTQLGMLIGNKNIIAGASGGLSPLTRPGGSPVPLLTNFPAAATSGIGFLLQPGSNVFLDAILTAAEANGKAKLISAPRITTQNNQPATVSQGTQIPVQTNVNNTVSVTFINFSLNLSVTPQITEAGTILLTVVVENSVPDFAKSVNNIPSVATQQAKTMILIPDGGTAVIGGIYVDSDAVNVRQVPGLGSLPVIGHMFKETATVKNTSELLFFVTPKIKSMDQITVSQPDVK